jgi:glycerol-3-phosphate acyltransferase PlsY
MNEIAAILISYLVGSIPFAAMAARARGIDLREHGSGNIGATNAIRVLGKSLGIPVLLADIAKGWAAAALVPWAFGETSPDLAILCGAAAVLGHTFPITLGFQGGKGVATSAGALFALAPIPTALALAVFLIVLIVFRYVSLASISAAVALALLLWIRTGPLSLRLAGTALAALVIARHRSNLSRLLSRTESRVMLGRARGKSP